MTDRFDLQAHLRNVYAKYPAAQSQPIIGITGNYEDLTCKLGQGYYKSVVAAGGVPIVIPPVADTNTLFNTLDHIDALILSGGGDFNPLYGGEEPSNRLHDINSERDLPELILTQMAYNRQMPILGICRGIQTLAMALGGRVWQDINEKTVTKHSQQAARSEVTHSVNIEEDSLLYQMYQENKMFVNSFHHQAVREQIARQYHRGYGEQRIQAYRRCPVASGMSGGGYAPVPLAHQGGIGLSSRPRGA